MLASISAGSWRAYLWRIQQLLAPHGSRFVPACSAVCYRSSSLKAQSIQVVRHLRQVRRFLTFGEVGAAGCRCAVKCAAGCLSKRHRRTARRNTLKRGTDQGSPFSPVLIDQKSIQLAKAFQVVAHHEPGVSSAVDPVLALQDGQIADHA